MSARAPFAYRGSAGAVWSAVRWRAQAGSGRCAPVAAPVVPAGGAAAVSTGMPGSPEEDEEKVVMIDSRGRLITITRLRPQVLPLG